MTTTAHTLSLAEIRNGTGFEKGARFVEISHVDRLFTEAIGKHAGIVRGEIESYAQDETLAETVEYWKGRVYGLIQARQLVCGYDSSHGQVWSATNHAIGEEELTRFHRLRSEREDAR